MTSGDVATPRPDSGAPAGASSSSSLASLPSDARCLSCGYDLTRLERPRCPECGRPFDPVDPLSFRHRSHTELAVRHWIAWQGRWRDPEQLVPLIAWGAVWAGFTVFQLFLIGEAWRHLPFFWCCPPLAFAFLARSGVRRLILGTRPEPHRRSERLFARGNQLVVVLFLALSIHRYHGGPCVHGARYGLGPVGVGHSTIGTPCNSPGISYWNLTDRWYVWIRASG